MVCFSSESFTACRPPAETKTPYRGAEPSGALARVPPAAGFSEQKNYLWPLFRSRHWPVSLGGTNDLNQEVSWNLGRIGTQRSARASSACGRDFRAKEIPLDVVPFAGHTTCAARSL